jgi:GntR family transcriptional regulator, transcriptional repressor for pyruvate dehydrogenase complex
MTKTRHGSPPKTRTVDAARAGDKSSQGQGDQWMFHSISNARAHDAVIEQITFAIRAGAFAPGDRMPHIGELAKSMQVSKPVIGEALKVLSQSGVLQVQRGIKGGLTVLTTEIPPGIMALSTPAPHLSVANIVEARRPVEVALALLAAERASEKDFEMLESCITALRKHRRAGLDKRIRYDHLFHYNIGRAARNQALATYQHQILEQLFLRMRAYFREIEDVDSVIALHEETLAALRSEDRSVIEQAVNTHLGPLEKAWAATPKSRAK